MSGNMEGYINNNFVLRKLMFLFQIIGDVFLYFPRFCSIARRYVLVGVSENDSVDEKEDAQFAAETRSLLYICKSANLMNGFKADFREFHDFTINCGMPMASILVSKRDCCRRCNKRLVVDGKPRVVVIYHIFHGTYLGSRITRCCRKCKISEHYGFWIENGERYFEDDFEDMEFLISSEETVFDMTLMRENASLLVMGALPFTTFAASYNRRFKYGSSLGNADREKSKVKRMKRFETFLLIYRCMYHRIPQYHKIPVFLLFL